MSWIKRWTKRAQEPGPTRTGLRRRGGEPADIDRLDPALQHALEDFKASVHAWSAAEFRRSRRVRAVMVQRTWRLAAGLSLATALIAGTISGQLYQRHVRQLQAEAAAAARQAELQHEMAAEKAQAVQKQAQDDEDLASIDSAISREVPSAMEPLAALGEETESQ